MTETTVIYRPPNAVGRFFRAYLTTFVVIGSYLFLNFKARLFGAAFRADRLPSLHQRNAIRIESSILHLQGLFIKVGQLFSIMTNFLPEELTTGLKNLQDAVPPRPFSQIEKRVSEELGGQPHQVFSSFEEQPLAAASLGQVHRAVTKDGRQVAVKIQHVGIEQMAKKDLKTIRRILGIIKIFVHFRGLDNFYHEIRQMIMEELDFDHEAQNMESIARNFVDNKKVVFPGVIPELSTSRVLTLEYMEGIKITDRNGLTSANLDPAVVAVDLVTVYCQMIFVDGLYHADPHPGNILVQPDGRIVLVDFGAVGHLAPTMRQGISSFMEAILKHDEEQLLRSLRMMGFLQVGTNRSDSASRVIEHFHRRFQEEIRLDSFSLSSIQIDTRKGLETLADLQEMDLGIREISSAFHLPKEWVLLERTALLLTGLCTHLDPGMNPAEVIRPYLEEFVLGKDRDWAEMLFDLTREKLLSVLSLPSQVEKVLNRSLAGKISFQVKGIQPAAQLLYSGVRQMIYTLAGIAAAGTGLYFHHAEEYTLARYAAYAVGGFATLVFLSTLRARRLKRRLH